MDDGKISPAVSLDWQEIEELLKIEFEEEERQILYRLYGLAGQEALSPVELRRFTRLKRKDFQSRLKTLENKLFRLLKEKELSEIFLDRE